MPPKMPIRISIDAEREEQAEQGRDPQRRFFGRAEVARYRLPAPAGGGVS